MISLCFLKSQFKRLQNGSIEEEIALDIKFATMFLKLFPTFTDWRLILLLPISVECKLIFVYHSDCLCIRVQYLSYNLEMLLHVKLRNITLDCNKAFQNHSKFFLIQLNIL